ncbi:conserved uncharacterized protein, UPF0153 [Desulfosarcina variabilis str. Montpellier]|uniref:YkgJ family cysteine cluster protein n=1 Tax=Desulfosarcina variabilis TaxID=2300 RepID=UPI003AFA8E9F
MSQNISCITCAECCKNYPYISLSQSEVILIAKCTTLNVDQFAESKEKEAGSYFLKFNKNGDCYFLEYDNGTYCCQIYEIRPYICRNYPDTTIQKEYCKGKIK